MIAVIFFLSVSLGVVGSLGSWRRSDWVLVVCGVLVETHASRCVVSVVLLEGFVFGSFDYLVLQFGAEVDEVVAVAGDSDHEVPVFLGMRLCFA